MRIQEIQRIPGDKEGLSTKGQNWGKETLSKIKMLPGSQRFGYTTGANADQTELQAIQKGIAIYSTRHPEDGGPHHGLYARWART